MKIKHNKQFCRRLTGQLEEHMKEQYVHFPGSTTEPANRCSSEVEPLVGALPV